MIPPIIPVNTYTGNSSTTIFDFDFLIKKYSELLVLHTDVDGLQVELKLNIDYTINELGNENGSFITFPILGSTYNKLADNETLSLVLNLPIMQETPYGTSAKLDLKTLEYSLDYIIRCIQMLDRKQERSVKVQEGSPQTADDLINALNNAQVNAVNAAERAETSANKAKDYENNAQDTAIYTKNYSDSKLTEITEKCNDNISSIENISEQKKQLVISTAENKINEINNTIKNIEGTVITGRFIGELIPAVIPILLSDGSLSQTVRFTNGDWISQNGIYEKGVNHIKMVASLYPHIACTSAEYDAMLTQFGECPKFVFNDETGMMRLPKIKSIIQGVTSLTDLAKVIQAGLPNITGDFRLAGTEGGGTSFANGCFAWVANGGNWSAGHSNGANNPQYNFNASRSSAVYGRSNTVQPQTVTGAYYIVLATGVDQNIKVLSNIEIPDCYPLLYPLYSDKLIFNTCFIRSSGQWNDAERYTTVWNYLIDKYTSGTLKIISGISYIEGDDLIKITDISNENKVIDLYNSTGSAWFYIIDIQNRKFKLPLADISRNNEYLYFKVGNAFQNPQLINVARIEDNINNILAEVPKKDLSNIAQNIDYVVYKAYNSSGWCRIYKSGWHVEGGYVHNIGYDGITTWNFIKPYKSVIYAGGATSYSQGNGDKRASWRIHNIQTTYIQIQARFEHGRGTIWWRTEGN